MSPRLVAFDAGHLQERGTDVALYDYADFNERLLGNRSIVLSPARSDLTCLDKFRARFTVCLYRDQPDLERALSGVDLYYRIEHGHRPVVPAPRPEGGRLGIHCVFKADQPHGDVYAAVSDWVARHRAVGEVPVVPHMVYLPDGRGDLRAELGIPRGATVLGRHGGLETFNIPFVREVVSMIVAHRPDLYFLFLNTERFSDHERILHLPKTADMQRKVQFIDTCDGMIHGRAEGETFGLSVGEFSIRNKPVLTWLGSPDRHHIDVLGDKGYYYQTPQDLAQLIWNFQPCSGDYDAFSERFAPRPVMETFARVFLETVPVARSSLALDLASTNSSEF